MKPAAGPGILAAMRSRRLPLMAGAVGGAAVLAVVLVVVATTGSSHHATTTTAAETTPGYQTPRQLFAGIPQHGDTLGKATAPATLTVFEDPQCPYCRQWDVDTLPTVVRSFVRTGKIRLVYRGIAIIGQNSLVGLRAIAAAGKQNKQWQLLDALYQAQGAENSGWITDAVIRDAAKTAGADGAAILAAAPTKEITTALTASAKAAAAASVQGTPSFFVQRPPGVAQELTVTSLEPDEFTAALTDALQ